MTELKTNKAPTSGIQLKLFDILKRDADDLRTVGEMVKTIHSTSDIDASGDELEIALRHLLRDRLPEGYFVTHGHIVDKTWNCSPQLDIIICNKIGAPTLFKTKSGAEYVPYESVYAIGEIKTTYYKKDKPIEKFVNTLSSIEERLDRDDIPIEYFGSPIGAGIHLPKRMVEIDTGNLENRTYQNPLFSFMFFLDAGDFKFSDIAHIFNAKLKGLPNLICFLNLGLIVHAHWEPKENLQWGLFPIPEFAVAPEDQIKDWVLFELLDNETRSQEVMGYLYAILMAFLQRCVLKQPDYIKYAQKAFKSKINLTSLAEAGERTNQKQKEE